MNDGPKHTKEIYKAVISSKARDTKERKKEETKKKQIKTKVADASKVDGIARHVHITPQSIDTVHQDKKKEKEKKTRCSMENMETKTRPERERRRERQRKRENSRVAAMSKDRSFGSTSKDLINSSLRLYHDSSGIAENHSQSPKANLSSRCQKVT